MARRIFYLDVCRSVSGSSDSPGEASGRQDRSRSGVLSVEDDICGISSWRPRISVEYLWDNGGPVISVEYNICGISSWRPRISVEYLWDNGGPEKEEGDLWNYPR